MDKLLIESVVSRALTEMPEVSAACLYGSWLYENCGTDADIAVFISSKDGLVEHGTYKKLRFLRKSLCKQTGVDIDLVPHTNDEFTDLNSPIWYPRYNPSLVHGQIIKGDVPIVHVSQLTRTAKVEDFAAYVIHDNRTICRRQLVRSLTKDEARIFASKLLHGPGNALTFLSCKTGIAPQAPQSNLLESIKIFDREFNVDSTPSLPLLNTCRNHLDFNRASILMRWYETLVNLCLKGSSWAESYCQICLEMKDWT